jgi:CelD/BcsL family acetyltransferase involved in cellulose biosynthesis
MMSAAAPDHSLSTLTTRAQLEALEGEWLALLERSADANTFHTPAWLLSWWNAYSPSAELRIVCARHGGRLVGLAPMMLSSERRHGLPVRCLRFLGDGTFESDHQGFIANAESHAVIQRSMLQGLLDLPWDVAVLSNVPESSALVPLLNDWSQRNRLLLGTGVTPCPARRLPESFDALLSSLPSRFRTAIRSTRRKLAAEHAVEFGLHDEPAEFDAALEALFRNHESRWRAKGQNGVFANPRRREFYAQLTRRLHERGELRFFYLKLNDRIVAQEFCFAHGRTVYLLQEGFDYALAALNLGNALRSYVFEYLIEHRYETYDFLGGTSRHKQNWSDTTPNDITFTITRPSLRGRWAYYAPRAVEGAKARIRPVRDRLRARLDAQQPGAATP